MKASGQELVKQPPRSRGGLGRDRGECGSTDVREDLADNGNMGRFGEDFAVFVPQMGILAFQERRRQVRGVGFEQKPVFFDVFSVFDGFSGVWASQSAAEGDKNIFFSQTGEGAGGAGVGMNEEADGMRGAGQENLQHASPGIATMNRGGQGEFKGQIELGEENGFTVGIEAVTHTTIEADFSDAGGARHQPVLEVLEPVAASILDEPWVEAEGAKDESGMGVGKGVDRGPVSFGCGGDMQKQHACAPGAGQNPGELHGEAGILQMAVGIHPLQILSVRRRRRC